MSFFIEPVDSAVVMRKKKSFESSGKPSCSTAVYSYTARLVEREVQRQSLTHTGLLHILLMGLSLHLTD